MITRAVRPFTDAGLMLAVLAAGGCGSKDGRLPIAGSVTFQGRPLDQGTITFLPATKELPSRSGAMVVNGQYAIPRDKGLVPGRYKVAISSPDGKTPAADGEAPPGPSGNFASRDRIPTEFNLASQQEIEVKKGGPNAFDFKIP